MYKMEDEEVIHKAKRDGNDGRKCKRHLHKEILGRVELGKGDLKIMGWNFP